MFVLTLSRTTRYVVPQHPNSILPSTCSAYQSSSLSPLRISFHQYTNSQPNLVLFVQVPLAVSFFLQHTAVSTMSRMTTKILEPLPCLYLCLGLLCDSHRLSIIGGPNLFFSSTDQARPKELCEMARQAPARRGSYEQRHVPLASQFPHLQPLCSKPKRRSCIWLCDAMSSTTTTNSRFLPSSAR